MSLEFTEDYPTKPPKVLLTRCCNCLAIEVGVFVFVSLVGATCSFESSTSDHRSSHTKCDLELGTCKHSARLFVPAAGFERRYYS